MLEDALHEMILAYQQQKKMKPKFYKLGRKAEPPRHNPPLADKATRRSIKIKALPLCLPAFKTTKGGIP
jgi:hypothetical protein